MGAERLDDVGKTVSDAEDRVFDLETPNFWHKQGEGRGTPSDHADRRRPSQTLRTTSTSPQSPAIGDNCLAKLVHPSPGHQTPFRQVLPAPERELAPGSTLRTGKTDLCGAPSRRDNHPPKKKNAWS